MKDKSCWSVGERWGNLDSPVLLNLCFLNKRKKRGKGDDLESVFLAFVFIVDSLCNASCRFFRICREEKNERKNIAQLALSVLWNIFSVFLGFYQYF